NRSSLKPVFTENRSSAQPGGAGEAAVRGVAGHVVVAIAEQAGAAGRLDADGIGAQHRTAHGDARGTAVRLISLDAGRAVHGRDQPHDVYRGIARAADRINAVADVEA